MLTVLDPVLDALTDGRVIRRYVAVGLSGLAWAVLAGGVLGTIVILKASFTDALPAEATIGGVLWALIFSATVWVMAQVTLYHAREVRRLPEDRFVVIPIASIMLRLIGENLATWCLAFGLAAFLLVVVAGQYAQFLMNATEILPGLSGISGSGLFSAAWVLVTSLATGFGVLLVFYFCAELVLVAADAANHLRQLVALAPPSVVAPAATPAPPPVGPVCPACGTATADPGTLFCERCGTRL